jgi:hypothetical protein
MGFSVLTWAGAGSYNHVRTKKRAGEPEVPPALCFSCVSSRAARGRHSTLSDFPGQPSLAEQIRRPKGCSRLRSSCRSPRGKDVEPGRGWGRRPRAPRRLNNLRSLTTRTTTDPIRQKWPPATSYYADPGATRAPGFAGRGGSSGRGKPVAEGAFKGGSDEFSIDG